jgi:hypothetical protein
METARNAGRGLIKLQASSERLMLTFRLTPSLTVGSERRANEITSRVLAMFERGRPSTLLADAHGVVGHFAPDKIDPVRKIVGRLGVYLEKLMAAPLHPKIVEEALGITALERSRWTKDGRLPRTGAGSFGLGKRAIFFPLYPIDGVKRLMERPDIIATWRISDGQEQP